MHFISSDCILAIMQTIADLLALSDVDGRLRGGDDVGGVLRAALDSGLQISSDMSLEVLGEELRDRMALMKAEQEGEGKPAPRMHTVRWYQANADELVTTSSDMTIRQACFCLASLKLRGGMTGRCMDDICRLLSYGGLMGGAVNHMPKCATTVLVL